MKKIGSGAILALILLGGNAIYAQNVGIGVVNPQEKLDVAGNARINSLGSSSNFNVGDGFVTADANGTLGKLVAPTGSGLELWYQPASTFYIRPLANNSIRVYDAGQPYGVYYDGGTNAVGGYFRTTLSPSTAVQGFSDVSGNQTYGYLGHVGTIDLGSFGILDGSAAYGYVDDPNRPAVIGRTALNASVAAVIGYSNVWIGGYFGSDDNNATYGQRPALYGQINVSVSRSGYQPAVHGISVRTATTGNSGVTVGGLFYGQNQGVSAQDAVGVVGIATGPLAAPDPNTGGTGIGATDNFTSGGYFQGNTAAWSFVGYDGATTRKIIGTGSVSEVIPTEKHGRITLTAPESPEYWYVDYGTVKLENGRAYVALDAILRDVAVIDAKNPIKVIAQPNFENCNGLAVINKSAQGFEIVELRGGTSNGVVDYQIIVKPKTNFGEGRFPQAPGPAFLKSQDQPAAARTHNRPDPAKIYRWPADWETYRYDPAALTPVGSVVPAGKYVGMYKAAEGRYLPQIPTDRNRP